MMAYWPEGKTQQPDALLPPVYAPQDLRVTEHGLVCSCGASWWIREDGGGVSCARCCISIHEQDLRNGDLFRLAVGGYYRPGSAV